MSAFLQLAPMQAMTDIFFMNTFHDLFGGFTEMMPPYIQASAKSPIKSQTLKRIFRYANPDITIVPQLLSNDAEGFVHVANSLYELGYKKINWNLGCPYPVVTKKMRGAGLIPHPDVINNILDKLDTELLPKLSVKIRLGLNHENELFDLVNVFNQHKIAEIIIHPRTADQKYEGEPKLSVFEEIYTQFNAPVIYNGNIVFLDDYKRIVKKFPKISGCMIGRGAFINPFITQQIDGKIFSKLEKKQLYIKFYYRQHHHFKQKTINENGFLARMKDLWWYFAQSFEQSETYFNQLKTINELTTFEEAVQQILHTGQLKI